MVSNAMVNEWKVYGTYYQIKQSLKAIGSYEHNLN